MWDFFLNDMEKILCIIFKKGCLAIGRLKGPEMVTDPGLGIIDFHFPNRTFPPGFLYGNGEHLHCIGAIDETVVTAGLFLKIFTGFDPEISSPINACKISDSRQIIRLQQQIEHVVQIGLIWIN
jgi:hypothetical protein